MASCPLCPRSNDDDPEIKMNDADALILVHTTCGNAEDAERLAGRLVEERLVACASIGAPIVSVYPWEGRIERESECPLTLKSTRSAFGRLRQRIAQLHDYDVPEVLAVEVGDASEDYADWVRHWIGAGIST
jgi:periplasmic divalent cation tolerance protein